MILLESSSFYSEAFNIFTSINSTLDANILYEHPNIIVRYRNISWLYEVIEI